MIFSLFQMELGQWYVAVVSFSFMWPCIVSKVWREKNQQDAIRCLLLTSISTCFGHHYAHLQESKEPLTAFGVLFWFCWMWLVAGVGRCLVGCEHPTSQCFTLHSCRTFNGSHRVFDFRWCEITLSAPEPTKWQSSVLYMDQRYIQPQITIHVTC